MLYKFLRFALRMFNVAEPFTVAESYKVLFWRRLVRCVFAQKRGRHLANNAHRIGPPGTAVPNDYAQSIAEAA